MDVVCCRGRLPCGIRQTTRRTRPTVFGYSGPPMKEPVWVDLFSGRVFEIPAANVLVHSCGVNFIDVPVYDSPCLIAERSDLQIAE